MALDLQCVHSNVGVVLGGRATAGRGVDCGMNEGTQREVKGDAERANCGQQRGGESSVKRSRPLANHRDSTHKHGVSRTVEHPLSPLSLTADSDSLGGSQCINLSKPENS